jgi:hypothetical protein
MTVIRSAQSEDAALELCDDGSAVVRVYAPQLPGGAVSGSLRADQLEDVAVFALFGLNERRLRQRILDAETQLDEIDRKREEYDRQTGGG